jgi:hypothetical protein
VPHVGQDGETALIEAAIITTELELADSGGEGIARSKLRVLFLLHIRMALE